MFNSEVRWGVLLPEALLIAMLSLILEMGGVWPNPLARPDWLWCLAFLVGMHVTPVSAIVAYAWCGLVRDFILGPKPGASFMAFVGVGWCMLAARFGLFDRGLFTQAFAAGLGAFLVGVCKHSLDLGWTALPMFENVFTQALGDGALTGLVFIPCAFIFALSSLRPWSERGIGF